MLIVIKKVRRQKNGQYIVNVIRTTKKTYWYIKICIVVIV